MSFGNFFFMIDFLLMSGRFAQKVKNATRPVQYTVIFKYVGAKNTPAQKCNFWYESIRFWAKLTSQYIFFPDFF